MLTKCWSCLHEMFFGSELRRILNTSCGLIWMDLMKNMFETLIVNDIFLIRDHQILSTLIGRMTLQIRSINWREHIRFMSARHRHVCEGIRKENWNANGAHHGLFAKGRLFMRREYWTCDKLILF